MRAAARELRVRAAPPRPSLAVAGALGICVAAAAAGAVAGRVHSHVGSAPAAPGVSVVVSYVALAGMMTLLVAGFTLSLIVRPRRQRSDPDARKTPPISRREKALIVTGLTAIALAPLVVLVLLSRHRVTREVVITGAGPGGSARRERVFTNAVHVQWTLFFALAVAGFVAVAYFAFLRRRVKLQVAEEAAAEDVLEPAVAAGMEALRSERDPRRAVIKAYVAMERTLGERELPRRPVETPFEYLRRVLVELGAAAASASRLTSLFEQARFSRHVIDEGMRNDAFAALTAVRGSEEEE